jgi:hypothetical protein
MVDLRGIEWNEGGSNRTPSGIRVNADNSMACSAYTACIRVISDAVSSPPLHVYERLANGGKAKASPAIRSTGCCTCSRTRGRPHRSSEIG